MVSINCVIAVWGGDRRGGVKDIVYVRKQLEQLHNLKHSLTQITLCISTDGDETTAFTDYIDKLSETDLPIEIMKRSNIGLSYGAYSDAYEKYRDRFDYYIFMEDDYYFVENDFDKTLINILNSNPKYSYVCGYVSRVGNKSWMGNSNGLTSSKIIEKIRENYGKLPYDESCIGKKYTEESGQVTFSNYFTKSGFMLADITSQYKVMHYYWQDVKVRSIPNQPNSNNKHLFLPFESTLKRDTSPFNEVFLPYKDKHRGQEAIIFATGPTLNAYDYAEDDGSRLRVGLNSMALKSTSLDYYFCGHVDERSKTYMDILKNYSVSIEKFGYVTLDGIGEPNCLSLRKAKELGLKPYSLSTFIGFENDISKNCLVDHLIIFSALQFLIYTGVFRIYLVGSDATQLISCDNYGLDTDRNVERIVHIFKDFARFASGRAEIISINPIGLIGIFQDCIRSDLAPYAPPTPLKRLDKTNYSGIQSQSILDAMNNGGYTG